MRTLFLLLACSLFSLQTLSQDTTDYIAVRSNPFFEGLLTRKGFVYPVNHLNEQPFGTPSILYPKTQDQILLKTPKYLYIFIQNSGRIYRFDERRDSLLLFHRLDITFAAFYNIQALLFTYQEGLYSFGGYGYWKTSGCLRKYNFSDREWDIVPLSDEIIPQVSPLRTYWFSEAEGKVFVPFQRVVNEGVKSNRISYGKILPESYVLDLNTRDWKQLGVVTDRFYELATGSYSGNTTIVSDQGEMVTAKNDYYWINYKQNRVARLVDPALSQSLRRIQPGTGYKYIYGSYLFRYDPKTNVYDSIHFDLNLFRAESFPIWDTSWQGMAVYAIPAFLAALLLMAFFYYRSRKAPPRVVTPDLVATDLHIEFTETEMSLLRLMIEKARKKQACTVEEMNYVMGLKDKNLGIQKKVRSDQVNSINQKFSYYLKDQRLFIQSVRSKEDKRYFEYFILPEDISLAEKALLPAAH